MGHIGWRKLGEDVEIPLLCLSERPRCVQKEFLFCDIWSVHSWTRDVPRSVRRRCKARRPQLLPPHWILIIQEAAGDNETVWCGLHCGSAIHTPACFLRLWGRRIRADDWFRFVARYVSLDTLRVRRLAFFCFAHGSSEAQSRRPGPCVPAGRRGDYVFPLFSVSSSSPLGFGRGPVGGGNTDTS